MSRALLAAALLAMTACSHHTGPGTRPCTSPDGRWTSYDRGHHWHAGRDRAGCVVTGIARRYVVHHHGRPDRHEVQYDLPEAAR